MAASSGRRKTAGPSRKSRRRRRRRDREGKATTLGHIQRHHLSDAKVVVPAGDTLKQPTMPQSRLLTQPPPDSTKRRVRQLQYHRAVALAESEFESLIADPSKTIVGDIDWSEDEDHSPAVQFRADVRSNLGYPLVVRGSYNALSRTLSYLLIHPGTGRIYALDLGKDHHNRSCQFVGEKHKHRWSEMHRDAEAYVPDDITAPATDPQEVWRQFCAEARITHSGNLNAPPPLQLEL